MIRLVLATALVCCVLGGSPCPAADTITEAQYGRVVARAASSIEKAARRGPAGLADARQALGQVPARVEVRSGAGEPVVQVDNRELLRDVRRMMRGDAASMRAGAERLRSLQGAVAASRRSPPANSQQVLRQVLAGREFRESWWERWQRRAATWVMNLIAKLLRRLPKPDIAERWLLIALWTVIGVAAVIIIAAIVSLLHYRRRPARRGHRAPPTVAPVRRSHLDWLAEAARAASAGDHREAIRALHMAALAKLDAAGVVSFDGAATDARYVWLLRRRNREEMAGALAVLNLLFARVWYGNAPARETEYEAAQEQWRAVEALAAA